MSEIDPNTTDWLRKGFEGMRVDSEVGPPLDPETIWAAAHGELDAEQTAAIVDRMARDPDLAEEWRLARAETPASQPALSSVVTPKRWRRFAYAASTLAAAAAVLLWVRSRDDGLGPDGGTDPGVYRGSEAGDTFGFEPTEGGVEWDAIDGAATYRVRLLDSNFEVVFEEQTDQGSLAVPRNALERATRWELDALGSNGRSVAEHSGSLR